MDGLICHSLPRYHLVLSSILRSLLGINTVLRISGISNSRVGEVVEARREFGQVGYV